MSTPQAPTFLAFLSGFAAQGLMQLGVIPNPLTGAREANLPYARYTLTLLEILKQKTAGNRTIEESQYLDGVIKDLGDRLADAGG